MADPGSKISAWSSAGSFEPAPVTAASGMPDALSSSSSNAPIHGLNVLRALIRRYGAAVMTLAVTAGSVLISMGLVAVFDRVMKGHVPLVDLIVGALIPAVLGPIATYGFARLSQELDRAEEQVRALATHDSLTGVLNHRQFMESARTELKRLARHERVATLIFMDIDRFKEINDQLGHATGDRALVEIAAACQALLRASDLIGRCGGDEFLALLSETDGGAAMIVAERIRKTIEALVFESPAGKLQPTVSIGLATSSAEIAGFELLYQRADRNLYLAKDRGRNRAIG
jgi:diguanylate cyclase (GGDEF)-like protein